MEKNIKYLATFFGVGLINRFEGTVATVISGAFFILVIKIFNISSIILAAASLFLFFISYYVVVKFQVGATDPDPREIVIDEVAGFMVSILYIPLELRYIIVAFILFRLFDISKPFFVKSFEKLPKGWGITFDDVAAGVLANFLLQAMII